MLLSVLTEVTWQAYASGRQKSTNRSYDKKDVMQFLKLSIGNLSRLNYYNNLKQTGKYDSSFVAPMLSIQTFDLGDVNPSGMRRADMSEFDVFRLPHGMHFTSVIPYGECTPMDYNSIPLVEAGEEYFYAKPRFKSFKFGVVKGRGINTYNLPPCVKGLTVEAPYVDDDTVDPDIPLDFCYDASNETLGRMIGMPDFTNKGNDNSYTLPQKNLKQRINQPDQPQ